MTEGTTIWDSLELWAGRSPSATAVVDEARSLTTKDLKDLAERIARCLAAMGVRRGDRVFAKARGRVEFVAAALASARLGAVYCPVNPLLGPSEVRNLQQVVEPSVMLDLGIADTESDWLAASDLSEAEHVPALKADPNELALLGFTGGTTGTPKAVMHTWETSAYAALCASRIAGLTPGDAIMATLPVGSAPGFVFAVHHALRNHGPLILLEKFAAHRALETAQDHQVRWMMAVPTQVAMLAESAIDDGLQRPLSGMKAIAVGGAPMHAAEVRRWEQVLGAPMLRMYGMSECLGHSSMRLGDTDETRWSQDGHPFPGTEVEAFDTMGQELPRGQRGQAGVKGPSLFKGYYRQPHLLAGRCTDAGFFLTGDTIVRDPDGHIEVLGRESDLIIRGGMNIDPIEIEGIVLRHPGVQAVAAVGVPDAVMGERIGVAVVPVQGPGLGLDELRNHFQRQQIAPFKWPERLMVVDELPVSAMGKVQKAQVRDWIVGSESPS